MCLIENVGAGDIKTGHHNFWGWDVWLIRIKDSSFKFHAPAKEFGKIFEFEFDDIEQSEPHCQLFTKEQAVLIIDILQVALEQNKHVVVHCFAGICRSGAVVEVAELMGFEKCRRYRQPNCWVKKLLIQEAFSRGLIDA